MEKRGWIRVPYNHQKTDYTCGPASIEMVLKFFGFKESEIRLAHEAHTKKKTGTGHEQMINLVRKHGFYCYIQKDSNIHTIKHFITRGFPAIINFKNPTDNDGHYAVVVGYSKGKIILNDPWNGKHFNIDDKILNTHWISEQNSKKWIMIISKKPIISGKQYNPIK